MKHRLYSEEIFDKQIVIISDSLNIIGLIIYNKRNANENVFLSDSLLDLQNRRTEVGEEYLISLNNFFYVGVPRTLFVISNNFPALKNVVNKKYNHNLFLILIQLLTVLL